VGQADRFGCVWGGWADLHMWGHIYGVGRCMWECKCKQVLYVDNSCRSTKIYESNLLIIEFHYLILNFDPNTIKVVT
jgi:hypothetical protein